MAEEESLELEETGAPKSKKKLFIIIGIVVVLLLAGGGAAWIFLAGGEEPVAESAEQVEKKVSVEEAFYVALPRPFLFNLPGPKRARLVEIKVQLMVRGSDDNTTTMKHIPLIEDALLTTFSGAEIQKLSTQAGKDEMRQQALLNVQNTLQPITGRKVVEKVLFTGFVMQ